MTLNEFLEDYLLDEDELARALLARIDKIDDDRKLELVQALGGTMVQRTASKLKVADLVAEVEEQLTIAKRLRDSLIDNDRFTGNVIEVQRALMAVDRVLETTSKRFSDFYNLAGLVAIEDATRECMAEMDETIAKRFLQLLEMRLSTVR